VVGDPVVLLRSAEAYQYDVGPQLIYLIADSFVFFISEGPERRRTVPHYSEMRKPLL
jgi:hypothetical protein